jgi:serine/threonine protein kinase
VRRAAIAVIVVGTAAALVLYVVGGLGGGQPSPAELLALASTVSAGLDSRTEAVRARAEALAALPVMAAWASTDAATLANLNPDDVPFQPAPGEIIEVGQLPREGRPVLLHVFPNGAQPVAPLDREGLRLGLSGEQQVVTDLVRFRPQERAEQLTGVVAVSFPLVPGQVPERLTALGIQGRLELGESSVPLGGADVTGSAATLELPLAAPQSRMVLRIPTPALPYRPLPQAGALELLSVAVAAVLARRKPPELADTSPGTAPPVDGRRYRLTRNIARGGMGEVWEGVALGSSGFERKVAIKRVFPDRQSDQAYLRMFVDEARIASNLHHANVVAVLDFGVANGVPFQVMEFVDGMDLSGLARLGVDAGRPFPPELALHVCLQVSHALQYAHEATDAGGNALRIVHRDVSPENVLVSWAGDVKLSDFGIAFAEGKSEKTAQGVMKGKLLYMAPEQATAGTVDQRADLFSLGCVLHRLLAGESPLAGDDPLANILAGGELTLSPSLPADVRPIVERAVRRSRFERYESAGAMAEALGVALAARLSRDPRLAMREWIAQIKPASAPQPPPEPRADSQPGEELVLASGQGSLPFFEERTFIRTKQDKT